PRDLADRGSEGSPGGEVDPEGGRQRPSQRGDVPGRREPGCDVGRGARPPRRGGGWRGRPLDPRDRPVGAYSDVVDLHESLVPVPGPGPRCRPDSTCAGTRCGAFTRGGGGAPAVDAATASRRRQPARDRKSTRLNSSHVKISYAVVCLK